MKVKRAEVVVIFDIEGKNTYKTLEELLTLYPQIPKSAQMYVFGNDECTTVQVQYTLKRPV